MFEFSIFIWLLVSKNLLKFATCLCVGIMWVPTMFLWHLKWERSRGTNLIVSFGIWGYFQKNNVSIELNCRILGVAKLLGWGGTFTYLLARSVWSKVFCVSTEEDTQEEKQCWFFFFSNALISSKFTLLTYLFIFAEGSGPFKLLFSCARWHWNFVSRGCRRDTVRGKSLAFLVLRVPAAISIFSVQLHSTDFHSCTEKKLGIHWSIHKYILTIMCGKYPRISERIKTGCGDYIQKRKR